MPRLMVTKIRERLGFSQREFASALGVQVSTVWRWETGRSAPREDMRAAIRRLEGVSPCVVSPDNVIVDGHQRVEAAVLNAEIEEPTVEKYKERDVCLATREVEIALLGAAGQITAGWVTGRRFPPDADEVADFIRKTIRALRQE